ncbi:hypothetical protein APSETT445_003634 [Aspergillus pseudonomiae]
MSPLLACNAFRVAEYLWQAFEVRMSVLLPFRMPIDLFDLITVEAATSPSDMPDDPTGVFIRAKDFP